MPFFFRNRYFFIEFRSFFVVPKFQIFRKIWDFSQKSRFFEKFKIFEKIEVFRKIKIFRKIWDFSKKSKFSKKLRFFGFRFEKIEIFPKNRDFLKFATTKESALHHFFALKLAACWPSAYQTYGLQLRPRWCEVLSVYLQKTILYNKICCFFIFKTNWILSVNIPS